MKIQMDKPVKKKNNKLAVKWYKDCLKYTTQMNITSISADLMRYTVSCLIPSCCHLLLFLSPSKFSFCFAAFCFGSRY